MAAIIDADGHFITFSASGLLAVQGKGDPQPLHRDDLIEGSSSMIFDVGRKAGREFQYLTST